MKCPQCGYEIKPRTTGPGSQSALLHALIARLAMTKDSSPALMKRYVKLRASLDHGYPIETMTLGGVTIYEPQSEAKATRDQESTLIDTCYELGMEWGIDLAGY